MDHDVAAWVTEEAERGTLSARRDARSQIPRSTADRFGVPPTPFTPPHRGDDHPGGLGTEMFLRRVRDTAARGPGASAFGRGIGPGGTGSKSPMPTPGGDAPRAPLAEHLPGVAPPDAQESLEHDDASLVRSEERAFARVVADVRAGAVAENETPAAFESVCRVRAAELRAAAASGDVARASTAHELLSEADDLDAEAATWSLAWFLLGEGAEAERESARAEKEARDAIAKRQRAGGDPASRFADGPLNANPLPAPLSARVRMAARDEMNDPVTFRANRVVAWLEGNARAAMTREAMGVGVADALRSTTEVFRDASRRFARLGDAFDDFGKNECAWNETARALDASATSDGRGQALSLELDPDGPNRLDAALHPTNADAEARLCRAAFRLVRGGMMDAARELCVRAGQPWRAASLGGAAPGPGGFAPAPVGAAADAAFAASAAFPVAAAMASARRATMDAESARETNETLDECMTDDAYDEIAFEAIASNADSPAADAEDEELAAECDDVSASSISKTGKKKETARRRALWKWACAETARQILAAPTFSPSARHEAALYGACAGDIRATLPACEGDWEASAWAYFRALLDARVDAAVDGGGGGGGATAPGPGPALLDDDDPGSAAADDGAFETSPRWPTAASAAATPRTAEEILETLRPLAAREARGARARLAQRDAQRCLILGRTRELAAEAAPKWVFPEEAPEAERVEADISGKGPSSPPPPGLLRFAAHMFLFLQTALPEGGGLQPGGALHFHLNKIVNLYVVHLVAERRYDLVPLYARHLRAPVLVETYARFLALLASASRETKARVLREALTWIPMEDEGGVRAVLNRALDDSREVVDPLSGAPIGAAATRGPRHREDVLEWACVRAETHAEAATHACALVRQLCLARTSAAVARENESRDRSAIYDDENAYDDVLKTFSGETRARRVVAELLPADLQANAAEADAPGAAAELGDWAAYLSAAASLRAWRDAAKARDVAVAIAGAGRGGAADAAAAAAEAARAAAARCARSAVDAATALAAPRAPELGFYAAAGGSAAESDARAEGFWLDSEVLVDAPEAVSRGLVSGDRLDATPPAARLLVAPVFPAAEASAASAPPLAAFAEALRVAVEARAAELPGLAEHGVEVRAEAAAAARDEPEASKDSFSSEAYGGVSRRSAFFSRGQILLEVSVGADVAGGVLEPVARRSLCRLVCEALKGELAVEGAEGATNEKARRKSFRMGFSLETSACDGSDPEIVREICRGVLWPSLLLEAAAAEADLGEGSSEVSALVADARRGLHALFSRREIAALVEAQRIGELNALAAGARDA